MGDETNADGLARLAARQRASYLADKLEREKQAQAVARCIYGNPESDANGHIIVVNTAKEIADCAAEYELRDEQMRREMRLSAIEMSDGSKADRLLRVLNVVLFILMLAFAVLAILSGFGIIPDRIR